MTSTTATIAARYNAKAREIMPHIADDLMVDPSTHSAALIDEVVFHRSEFLGGMAAVILALVKPAN